MTPELDTLPKKPRSELATTLRRKLATIATFLAVIWSLWLLNTLLGGYLTNFGIVPRTLRGLPGILFAPFLHANFSHAFNNTIGILLLGTLLILRNENAFWNTSILGALATGLGTWIIGRGNSVHIGASGVILAYFGYLLTAGIFEKKIGSILLSLLVFFLWGGMLWSVLPTFNSNNPISWEGHLCGFAGGVFTAWLLSTPRNAPGSIGS